MDPEKNPEGVDSMSEMVADNVVPQLQQGMQQAQQQQPPGG